ncbi:MAG: 5-formyltetrahydrofolate cyclo-ligase [Acidobacteria bacterium]|nr:5-formyltetrahydrofolate cyclo-ligase [Acidobacteriota bacterium]
MKKAELRKTYLAERKNLSSAERTGESRAIAARFFQKFDLTKIEFLHCFLPIEKFNEIETPIILQKIWREFPNIETLAPRVNFQTGEIENLKYTPATELARNVWRIAEPIGNELIAAEKIDLVLAPLLVCDRKGFRVGYGKGFYDKFLRRCRRDCLKIGLSYFAPTNTIADVNEFDVKLDYCVTPENVYDFAA